MAKYHMNRKDREITELKEIVAILQEGKYAVISMCRDNEPYIVTLNYGYDTDKNALYFHNALQGLKIDFIKCNPNVCATVIDDRGYIMNECAHAYRSVVFWGKMSIVEDIVEKKHAMEILLNHLEDNPDIIKERSLKNDEVYSELGILRLDIMEITGKKGR